VSPTRSRARPARDQAIAINNAIAGPGGSLTSDIPPLGLPAAVGSKLRACIATGVRGHTPSTLGLRVTALFTSFARNQQIERQFP
jgi:hypothetical protein